VHHDEPYAETVQQVEVMDDAEECIVGDDLAAKGDDQRLAAQTMNIGSRRTNPLHERARRGRICGETDARSLSHWRSRRSATKAEDRLSGLEVTH
jgi:hypothetical protein